MTIGEIGTVIHNKSRDGNPVPPKVILEEWFPIGTSKAKIREAVWWLLGKDYLELTESFELRRVR